MLQSKKQDTNSLFLSYLPESNHTDDTVTLYRKIASYSTQYGNVDSHRHIYILNDAMLSMMTFKSFKEYVPV